MEPTHAWTPGPGTSPRHPSPFHTLASSSLEKGAKWEGGVGCSAGEGASLRRPGAWGLQHLPLSAILAAQAWSHAPFCPGIEFHFQPLLGGSHGSLRTFDKEAKYTSEAEEAWAAVLSAWARRSRLRGASLPRAGGRLGPPTSSPPRVPTPPRPPPHTHTNRTPDPDTRPGQAAGAPRPARGPLAEEGGAAGSSAGGGGRCWWAVKAHLAARVVRSPPEPVLPGYLGRPRRAPTCRGPIIKWES
ncbi:uncharacterized protein LOC132349917 [Balaenoptera ricei]|uniref:uncharacterized protein LOC132349917 n=1 Tax=Balaenoptera ricei TaxID=2746895 RepID=UPI0028BF3349|nr:uncharacterized protein LOC132349917 [Balaenoptera ricei]